MTNETKPVLLTELEAVGAWREAFTVHRKSFDEYKAWLRERGLLAPEPVDPLLIEAREICAGHWERRGIFHFAGKIREGVCDDNSDVESAFAALRRGMELAKPELTRERLGDAVREHIGSVGNVNIDRLHAFLTEGQSK